jgi:hypothetical protein
MEDYQEDQLEDQKEIQKIKNIIYTAEDLKCRFFIKST